MKTLLLDIGNTRIKAAWLDTAAGAAPPEPGLTAIGAWAHRGDAAATLGAIDIDAPARVWIASVHGSQVDTALSAVVQTRWQLPAQFARSQARFGRLRSAYDEPQRLGVDRWLAMIASQRTSGAALVIDAGTALTADVVDEHGQHRGGYIAAGLLTAQKAVLGATRFDTRDKDAHYDGGLGTHTEACVRQGAMLACLGAIDRAAAIAGPSARRLITGGDAAQLLPYLQGDWAHRTDLVLEGLARLAADIAP